MTGNTFDQFDEPGGAEPNPFDQFDEGNPFDQFDVPDQLYLPDKREPLIKRSGSKAIDYARATLQGPTFGFADEIGSGIAAGVAKLAGDEKPYGDIYREMQGQVHAEQEGFREENPVLATGLEVVGSLPMGLVAGGKVAAGKTLGRQIGRGVATGAASGAAYGAGTAEEGERLEGGAKGAAIGATVGGVLPAAGVGLKKLGGAVGSVWKTMARSADDKADDFINTLARDAGLTPEMVVQKLDELGEGATLADVDKNFLNSAVTLLNKNPKLKQQVGDFLTERQTGQRADIVKNLVDDIGDIPADNLDDALDGLAKARSKQAGPLYREAFDAEVDPGKLQQHMDSLENMPALQKALGAADDIAANDRARIERLGGVRVAEGLKPMERLHYAKKWLWDEAQSLRQAGRKGEANQLNDLRVEVIDDLLNANKQYKQARKLWADSMDIENASEVGALVMKPGVKSKNFEKMISKMSDSERQMARLSAIEEIVHKIEGKVDNASITNVIKGSELSRKKIRALFGSDDAFNAFLNKIGKWDAFQSTRHAALGGSPTQPRQAGEKPVEAGLEAAGAFGSGGKTVALSVLRRVMSKLTGDPSADVAEKAAKKLFDPNVSAPQAQKMIKPVAEKTLAGRVAGGASVPVNALMARE